MIWKERLLNKDISTFKKYIESTSANGVVRIFQGKSVIRRLFWLIIILIATGVSLYNIIDRIQFLISSPTSTAISISRKSTQTFPAVTVCNLNSLRRGALDERNLTDLIESATLAMTEEGTRSCEERVSQVDSLNNAMYEELAMQARHDLDSLILSCTFAGEPCGNITEVFKPVFTNLGICYTFNFDSSLKSKGTGQRQGLQLVVDVEQLEYTIPNDAGVKVAIHTPSEPPLPDDQGIGVPTGRNAFISIKEQSIEDKTGQNCKSAEDLSNINFLQGEYSIYTASTCLVDCLHTSIADKCDCIVARSFYSPDTADYSQHPNCTLEKICCIENQFLAPNECNCPAACSSISYETTVSYSHFPAQYISDALGSYFGIPESVFPANLLQMSIYFETLNIEIETTTFAYSPIALLSDIGGILGLFLGVSVITMIEFGTWIVDEIKNRVFGLDEEKIKNMCCSRCKQELKTDIESQAADTAPGPAVPDDIELKVV
jgi:hypothetical protein